MKLPDEPPGKLDGARGTGPGSSPQAVRVQDVVKDLHTGMRTRAFLDKYDIGLEEFQEVLKYLIREWAFPERLQGLEGSPSDQRGGLQGARE